MMPKGSKHSPEARAKISASLKGRRHTEEHNAKMRKALRGKKRTLETRARISASKKGKPSTFKGRTHTDEARAKMSAAHKGIGPTQEAIAKAVARNTGQRRSEETRRKMSEARRRRPPLTLEQREKLKGRRHPPEVRKKIGEASKLKWERYTPEQYARLTDALIAAGSKSSKSGTLPERWMASILRETGVTFESQKRFGRYVVDFYLPKSQEAIEVDGVYWHRTGPNEKRDAYLLSHGLSAVHHITDRELKELVG